MILLVLKVRFRPVSAQRHHQPVAVSLKHVKKASEELKSTKVLAQRICVASDSESVEQSLPLYL